MDSRKIKRLTDKIKEIEYTLKMLEKPSRCKVSILSENEHESNKVFWYRDINLNKIFVREALRAQIQDFKNQMKEELN